MNGLIAINVIHGLRKEFGTFYSKDMGQKGAWHIGDPCGLNMVQHLMLMKNQERVIRHQEHDTWRH